MGSAVASRMGNLPVEVTSFVGRRRQLTEAKRLLSASPLLTLTGIGGVGKTRLALRVAAEVRRAFPDGVWFVELGGLQDPALVAHTVAATLGLREQPGRLPMAMLAEYLAPRRLLLVLDNCEHLVDACAVLADTLLRASPELRVLATSREPLGIAGEATLPVPTLSVPDPDRPGSLQGLSRYEAVTLFTDRAAAAVHEFGLTEDNQIAVAEICHRLDGLPLAIELAAVRLRALSPNQILDRLTDRYRLLTQGSRSAPSRQQTLRSCIEWSYELCSAPERGLWARLAVFAGGFELDAIEGICAGGDLAPEDLLDVVASLVDKSILIRQEHGALVRFQLLETIREFGRERLQETGEYTALLRRHRDWYEQLVLRADAEWIAPRQADWFARLDVEWPNIRAAMDFCLTEPGEAKAALRIAVSLPPFYWWARGLLTEGRRWLDQALAHATEPSVLRARALLVDSRLTVGQGNFETGMLLLEKGQDLAQQLGDPATLSLAAYVAGHDAMYLGDLAHAVWSLEQALTTLPAGPYLNQRVDILVGLAMAAGLGGDEKGAVAYYEQVLALTEARGESAHRSYSLWALGLAAWRQGDHQRAATLVQDSLRLKRGLDDRFGTGWNLDALAWMAAADGRHQRAATLLGATAALSQAMGSPTATFPELFAFHQECERRTRRVLGDAAFEAAFRHGRGLSFEDAVGYALNESPQAAASPAGADTTFTPRERQVADLVAQGLTNKEIAAKLVISQRTAEGHVEHILAKLGVTSRAQVAAWVAQRPTTGRDSGSPS